MTIRNETHHDDAAQRDGADAALRRRAEERARAMEIEKLEGLTPEQIQRLFHELRVYQIELEMQSEELRRVQEALEISRERYFDLYDLAPVGYVTLSEQGVVWEANLTAATLLGTPRGALVKQPLTRFILPEDEDIYYHHHQQLFATGESQVCELRMVRQDGTSFWARLDATKAQEEESDAPVCRVTLSDITGRKEEEEGLRKYQRIVSLTPDGIAFVDADYRCRLANDSYERFSGVSRDRFLGLTVAEYIGEDVFQREIKPYFDRCLQGETIRYQTWFEYPTLGRRFVDVSYFPYRDVQERIVGVVASTRDMTEVKQAELDRQAALEALRESERRLHKAQQIGKIGDWEWIPGEDKATWSPEMYAIFGITPGRESVTTEESIQAFHPEDRPLVAEATRAAREGRRGQSIECRVLWPDGTIRYVYGSGEAVLDADGNLVKMVGIYQDITERKVAEQQRQAAQEHFAMIFNLSPDMAQITRLSDGCVLDINEGVTAISGFTREDIVGKSTLDIDLWENPSDRQNITAQLISKGYCDNYEVVFKRKDGSRFFGSLSARLYAYQGKPHVITITRDITGRRVAEEQIKRALAEKENLLRELYHRTKNNMQVIRSILALQAAHTQDPTVQTILHDTENRIQAMSLVHQMLYRSQDLSYVDLRQYLHDLTTLLVQSYRISPERITFDFDLAEERVSIDMAIPCGLVFHEMVSNALKYAFPQGHSGTLTIRLARIEAQMLELMVSDDGVGVPPGFDFRAQETLGFEMILALTEHQLQGEAIFESDHGVTWRLRFPDTLYAARV